MIKSMMTLFVVSFAFLFVPMEEVLAQEEQAVDSLFYQGITYYREGRYRETLRMMELIDQVYTDHPRKTGSLLMQGKSLYKLKEYQKSLEAFDKLISDYPQSEYTDDALYGVATVYYRMHIPKEALKYLMRVIEEGKDSRLIRKAAKLTSDIMDNLIGEEDLEALVDEMPNERGKAAVILRLGRRKIDESKFHSALRILTHFLEQYPNSTYTPQVEELLRQAEEMGKGFFKLGVILPLTGIFSEQGNAFLQGFQYAIDRHNAQDTSKVQLVVHDSEGNIVRAIQAAQQLCRDGEILAIVGELESDLTAAIAAVAEEAGVALLAPMATMDGISSIGPNVFQANSCLSIQGQTLAEYAISGLGLSKFAILAPVDEYGKSMRDAFVRTAERLGAEIVAEKWYYEEDVDLGPQFREFREMGLRRMIQDSLVILVPEEKWPGVYDERSGDVLYVKQTFADLMDSTGLAVTCYDGIFLPIYGEDLDYVAPQLANYNIHTRIFGGTFWHNPEKLEENDRYVDGAVFVSDFYVDPSAYQYHTFRDAYRIANGKTPEKMETYGYDTANLLLDAIGDESLSRHQIVARLSEKRSYDGIRGAIVFNQERVNTSVSILQYRGGRILRIR
jgi:ABC-type branched-subunit amino acid transport system substrate-binding protein/outer membrane protein assembly factor BamD (BamD/ComL family)